MRILHPLLQEDLTNLKAIKLAYTDTASDCILRKLFIADLTHYAHLEPALATKDDIEESGLAAMPAFLLDLAEAMRLRICGGDWELDALRGELQKCLLVQRE